MELLGEDFLKAFSFLGLQVGFIANLEGSRDFSVNETLYYLGFASRATPNVAGPGDANEW
jgi:hypothetical protein